MEKINEFAKINKYILKSLLLGTFFLALMIILIWPSSKNKRSIVMPVDPSRSLNLEENKEFIQTFFPLKNNVTSISLDFISNCTNDIMVRIYNNDTKEIYYEEDLEITKSGEQTIKLSNPIQGCQDKELYIQIIPVKLDLVKPLQIVLTNSEYKDNHLFFNGVESTDDIAISVDYDKRISHKIIGCIVLFIMLVYLSLIVSSPKKSGEEWNATYIDLIRVLAAGGVLLIHLGQGVPFSDFVRKYTDYGTHGVEVFFVISGFYIFASLQKNGNIKRFYCRRLSRIVPIYYVMITIVWSYYVLAGLPVPSDSSGLYWWRYIFFLSTLIPTDNSFWFNLCATWTIGVFMIFYLLAPFFCRIINTFWKSVAFIVSSYILGEVVILLGLRKYYIHMNEGLSLLEFNPFRYMWIFAFGISAYFAIKEKKEKTFIGLLMLVLLLRLTNILINTRVEYSIIISIMLVLFYNKKIGNKRLNHIVILLNPYTYCLYIIHPLVLLIFSHLHGYFDSNRQFGFAVLIIIGLSVYVIHHLFEVPMGKVISKLGGKC